MGYCIGMDLIQTSSKSPIPTTTNAQIPVQAPTTLATTTSVSATNTTATAVSGVSKPKQSKSRDGCVTCKLKRLKCDETKPECRQCQKRNVQCGGYKKDFKWKPFGESSYVNKHQTKTKKVISVPSESSTPSHSKVTTRPKSVAPSHDSFDGLHEDGDRQNVPSALSVDEQPSLIHTSSSPRDTPTSQNFLMDVDDRNPSISDVSSSSIGQTPSLEDDILSEAPTVQTPKFIFGGSPFSPGYVLPFNKSEDSIIEVPRLEGHEHDDTTLIPQDNGSPLTDFGNLTPDIPWEIGFHLESPEMLLARFDRQTCGILSVKDGVTENPWRTLIWPLAPESPAVYHAICSLAAFHNSKENPELRFHGMDHMRRSIRSLAMNMENMQIETALATTLALTFAESWDRHISTGIQHLRGAKVLFDRAWAQQLQQRSHPLKHDNLPRLNFLYNTWVYIAVIAQLTSLDDTGFGEIQLPPISPPNSHIHKVDPLMGCSMTLFPLISRVAILVQKVRKSKSNSIAVISQAIELKTLIEQWTPPRYFEPPEDPTSDVQHSFQTAQAYRWATLLHLHQAVPEIPSESAGQLAKRVLVLLATVPLSSRTTVVHVYPLLCASCEVDSEEDREWVRERWAAMQSRLMIGNVDRCLEVICEIWARRDEYNRQLLKNQQVPFVIPVDTIGNAGNFQHDGNNNTNSFMCKEDDPFCGELEQYELFGNYDDMSQPLTLDMDNMGLPSPPCSSILYSPSIRRGSCTSIGFENIDFEKSVRGSLHWIGVMKDWNWEVLLG